MIKQGWETEKADFLQLCKSHDLRVRINTRHNFQIQSDLFRFKESFQVLYDVYGALTLKRMSTVIAKIKMVLKRCGMRGLRARAN